LRYWLLALAIGAVIAASAASLMLVPCVTPDPALQATHDQERAAMSSRAAAMRDEALLACGNDPVCIASTATAFTRFEAEALRALALAQHDAVVSLCGKQSDER
jgi:hypothetical protein